MFRPGTLCESRNAEVWMAVYILIANFQGNKYTFTVSKSQHYKFQGTQLELSSCTPIINIIQIGL